jgi:hypothetical protein
MEKIVFSSILLVAGAEIWPSQFKGLRAVRREDRNACSCDPFKSSLSNSQHYFGTLLQKSTASTNVDEHNPFLIILARISAVLLIRFGKHITRSIWRAGFSIPGMMSKKATSISYIKIDW